MNGMSRKKFVMYSLFTWVSGLILTIAYFYKVWLPQAAGELRSIIGTRHLTDSTVIKWILSRGISSSNPEHAAIASVPLITACLIALVCFGVYSFLCFKRMTDQQGKRPGVKRFIAIMMIHFVNLFLNKVMFGIYSIGLFLFLAIFKSNVSKIQAHIEPEIEE